MSFGFNFFDQPGQLIEKIEKSKVTDSNFTTYTVQVMKEFGKSQILVFNFFDQPSQLIEKIESPGSQFRIS